ncbi:DUF3082 domain-containing protein [Phormidium tenue FACHB-886]|nr:DUF3082 domain-containing protein [Phormidium tenue FACHB-886]
MATPTPDSSSDDRLSTSQTPPSSPTPPTQAAAENPPTPLRCFIGAVIAGGFSTALYLLTQSIVQSFAGKPLPRGNQISINIAIAVRTLVVGMSTLATAIFAIAAAGLIALGIQLLIQQLRQPSSR